jgi:hypothetical protein
MKKSDVKDTMAGRQELLAYLEEIEADPKNIQSKEYDKFLAGVIGSIFSEPGLIAYKEGMERVKTKINREVDEEILTRESAEKIFDKSKHLLFKHAVMLEILHKCTRAKSMKENPNFYKDIILKYVR